MRCRGPVTQQLQAHCGSSPHVTPDKLSSFLRALLSPLQPSAKDLRGALVLALTSASAKVRTGSGAHDRWLSYDEALRALRLVSLEVVVTKRQLLWKTQQARSGRCDGGAALLIAKRACAHRCSASSLAWHMLWTARANAHAELCCTDGHACLACHNWHAIDELICACSMSHKGVAVETAPLLKTTRRGTRSALELAQTAMLADLDAHHVGHVGHGARLRQDMCDQPAAPTVPCCIQQLV